MASRTTSRKAGAAKAPARSTRTTRTDSATRSTVTGRRSAKANGTAAASSTAKAAAAANTEVSNKSGLPKLARGGLETAVSEHMAANPRSEFTPADLARVLNRSSGAIANALAKFTAQGKVTQTNERPRRYRLAGAKAARATSARKR
jgi:hypothetical protein